MAVNIKQVYDWLGVTRGTHDLGYICNNNNHHLINKWSRHKPMQYNGSDWFNVLTDTQRATINWGWSIDSSQSFTYYTLSLLYRGINNPFVVAPEDEYKSLGYGWTYEPNTSKFRLSDWQYYDHGINWIIRCYPARAIYQSSAITINFESVVDWSKLLSSNYNGYYLGFMLVRDSGGYPEVKTFTEPINNQANTTFAQLTVTTNYLTPGTYKIYPFLSDQMATTFACDSELSYYVSKINSGNCKPIPIGYDSSLTVDEAPVILNWHYTLTTNWTSTTCSAVLVAQVYNNGTTTQTVGGANTYYTLQGYNDLLDSWENITVGTMPEITDTGSVAVAPNGGSASWHYSKVIYYDSSDYKRVRLVVAGQTSYYTV